MGILEGKVAIVTGASSGIGKASARLLAKEGAAVVIGARRKENLDALVKEIEAAGGKATAVKCDVFNDEDLDALVKCAIDTYGTVDILANIAQGNMEQLCPLELLDEENALKYYRSGPLQSLKLMQKCFPIMKEKNYGRIINTCSHTALMGLPGYSGYGMAKEAIRGLTRFAAMEWGRYGIVTNAFLPVCRTEIADREPGVAATFEAIAQQSPLGWVGEPDDVAKVVLFLASEDSKYINGQFIGADGGWRIFG